MIEADGGPVLGSEFNFGRVNNGFLHTDALAKDLADVATLVFANFELIEAKHRGMDVDFFALKDYGVPDFNQLVLTSTETILFTKRDAVVRLIRVLKRAIEFIQTDRAEAKRIYFAHTNTSLDDPFLSECWESTVNCFRTDFSMEREFFEELSTWMFSRGLTKCKVDVDTAKVWTNELL
jgi:ABC-type nitrate/sulfonate/bicarbonate transport system substrate-binding protein